MPNLSDREHAEFLMLYRNALEDIDRAKREQWTQFYAILLAQVGVVGLSRISFLPPFHLDQVTFVRAVLAILMVLGLAVIFTHQLQLRRFRNLIEEYSIELGEKSKTLRAKKPARPLHRGLTPLLMVLVLLLVFIFCSAIVALPATEGTQVSSQDCSPRPEGTWAWLDRDGKTRSKTEFQEILDKHKRWVHSDHKTREGVADLQKATLKHADFRRANLIEANLAGSDLSYADLSDAELVRGDFQGATLFCTRLERAQLGGAKFTNSDLSHAIITPQTSWDGATLTGASLKDTNLEGVNFSSLNLKSADLTGSDLTNAELQRADLRHAILKGTRLVGTHLDGALLQGSDLSEAQYEVATDPAPRSIAYAKNLERLTHNDNSESLARLRGTLKEAGFRDAERRITFALKSRVAQTMWDSCDGSGCIEYWANRILFDLTSQYGMNTGRVLKIIVFIFLLCTALYWLLIHYQWFNSSLVLLVGHRTNMADQPDWLKLNLSQTDVDIQENGVITKKGYRVQPADLQALRGLEFCRAWFWREIALLRVSLFFSLMSTFNIKFREVDFGRWLRQLTTKEYDLKASGLARSVSGAQALLSAYFIALLLVTYFGRPFE
jgi:uncharacterized protein YjbI with pentapeptide repeats